VKAELVVSDTGAGSKGHGTKKRSIRSIMTCSSVPHKYGRILYSLARVFKPATVIELGTGIGISTAYLSAGNPEAEVISIEADSAKVSCARKLLADLGICNAEICNGIFKDVLLSKIINTNHPLLVFVDGDHSYESAVSYFGTLLKYKREDTIIVFDDIRWSEGMFRAWKEIVKSSEASLSIDLFFMGIVFFRRGITKQEFVINF